MFWPRVIFGLLFVLVTFLTLTPNPDDTKAGFAVTRWIAELVFGNPALADKVAHFAAYGVLGASAVWAELALLSKRRITALALGLYGVLLEGLQGLGGVRTPELADAVANGLGAVAGIGGAIVLARMLRKLRAA
ncbi:VanZ family protein [Hyphococcus sp.]|uniref:VanZ family protein n=1 Tax=Hyphococcus sp. TaxID=2038636 RepID=UPI002084FD9C|nr:MAG: hypothetical protein DHS20C04_15360 [Marinicaulis sp.]